MVRWEICRLVQLGRIELDLDDADVTRTLARLHTWPLSWQVCRESCRLDVKGADPADELIGATSVVHGVPLVTRDRRLRRSKRIPWPLGRGSVRALKGALGGRGAADTWRLQDAPGAFKRPPSAGFSPRTARASIILSSR